MTTVTIPKELAKEGELVLLPRRQYEELLRRSALDGTSQEKRLWQKASQKNFLKLYGRSDSVYDAL